jgi:rhamnogalacturonyl hydrolase YesR
MVPPFIAYFAAFDQTGNKTTLLQAAYDQCRLYRKYLQDPTTKLWKHVVLGSWQDNGLWGTGNGWAAAGMLRVLQTISNSDVSGSFLAQQQDLLGWIEEIVGAAWKYQVRVPCYSTTSLRLLVADVHPQTSSGALRNVINDSGSFTDSASTALIASVAFRLAVLNGNNATYIANANAAYNFVYRNIDSDGWLRNTVDPLTFNSLSQPDDPSPEGQSFVLLLESARRDFQDWVETNATLPSGAGGMVGQGEFVVSIGSK